MDKKRLILLNLLFFLFLTGARPGRTEDHGRAAKAIDRLVEKHIELDKFNGCFLVAKDRKIIYERVHGISDPATGEKLTLEHRFRLASVSKQFAGLAVMILKQDGKLDYDDPVREYLPDLPYRGITIRHLLTHTSGLPDYGSLLESYWDTTRADSEERRIASNRDAYRLLVEHSPPALFKPGEKHSYCNTGYNILALVIERVSGKSYHEFMRTRIFEPAGMNSTFVNPADGTLPDSLRARGFRENPAGPGYIITDRHYQNGMFGDGGIYSTVGDLFRYDQALYGDKLVSPGILKEGLSPSRLNDGSEEDYGFGWSILSDEGGDFVAHGGGWAGFSPFFIRDYNNGNTIIQLTNRPGITRGELAFAVHSILRGGKVAMPKGSIARVLLREINERDTGSAIETYYTLKKTRPDDYNFSEGELNRLGYQLLGQNRFDEAVLIFIENVRVFPDSWNVYDSLAEAYMKRGQREKAIENYNKSLSMNPENDNARRMLQRMTGEKDL